MPRFAFGAPPTEALDAAVRAAFGLWSVDAADRVRINAYTFVALDALRARLLEVHRPRDRGACVPLTWTTRVALKLLRHFVRHRDNGLVLVSKVVKSNFGRCERAYYVRRAGESVPPVDRLDPTAFVMIE